MGHFEIQCFHATGYQDGLENVSRMLEKVTHSVIFSNLNCCGIVKSVKCEYLLAQMGEWVDLYSRIELQMFWLISGRHYCVPLQDTTMAFPY